MSIIPMEKRKQDLEELRLYVKNVDNDISMILQNLQWDQKHLLQGVNMAQCSINKHHRIPEMLKECHEKECLLRFLGYDTNKDVLLPDPVYPCSKMCIKFSIDDVQHIIEKASNMDSKFQKVNWTFITLCLKYSVCAGRELPLSQPRLQCVYTADERRALHHAALAAAPSAPELALTLTGEGSSGQQGGPKSRLQLLAEQRDMKRRRAKYRVATKSKNYSQVLREVIHNQLEMYAEIQAEESNRVKAQETVKNDECSDFNELSSVEQTRDTNKNDNTHSKKKLYDDDKQRRRTEDRHTALSKPNEECLSRQTFDYSNVKPGPSTDKSSYRHVGEHRRYNEKDKKFNKSNDKIDRHDYRNTNFDKHSQFDDRNKSNVVGDFYGKTDNNEHCKRDRDQYSKSDIDQYIKGIRDKYSQKDMDEYSKRDKNLDTKRDRNKINKRDIDQYSKRDKIEYSNRDINQYSKRKRDDYSQKDMDEYSKRDNDQYSKRDRTEFSKRDIDQYSKRDKNEYRKRDIDQYSNRKRDDYSQKDTDQYSKRDRKGYNKRDIDQCSSEKDKNEYRRYYDYPSGSK